MKINLTKGQYEALLKLVFLGEIVARLEDGSTGIIHSNEVKQRLFSKAVDYGYKSLVTFYPELGLYDLNLKEAIKLEPYFDKLLFALKREPKDNLIGVKRI